MQRPVQTEKGSAHLRVDKAGLSDNDLKTIYKLMILTRTADAQAVSLQRQGRISFYVSCEGEEASEVASAFALKSEDWSFIDYRASGVVLTRGLDLIRFFSHLMGNTGDDQRGRSMPSHWGSKKLNIVTPSSPICTQLPHSVGVGLGAKFRGDRIATIAYFGDGGTSSNDFHSALNFAGVFDAPCVFFCRNNGYAISVPIDRQTATRVLADKASAYSIEGVRVDGNDPIAVYAATSRALEKARNGGGPTLIEAVTYRLGAHSTSDDPKNYRDQKELESWRAKDPLITFRNFLTSEGIWNEESEQNTRKWAINLVKDAVAKAEAKPPIEPEDIVREVYSEIPWNLEKQLSEACDEFAAGKVEE